MGMPREKRTKPKIKRRSAGLVITPPAPRPVSNDHPARLLFRDAIESEKGVSAVETELSLPDQLETVDAIVAPIEAVEPEITEEPAAPEDIQPIESTAPPIAVPLNIFKELKETTIEGAAPDLPAPVIEAPHSSPISRRDQSGAFLEHFAQWKPFLTDAQMYILEALFNMTHALGQDNCMTSMPKLAAAAGVSERQTYNVVKELERHGFIERPETFNTPTKKGTIFRLHLTRRESPTDTKRRYHFGD